MATRYQVTLRADQMDYLKNLLLGEASDLIEISSHLEGFSEEQREIYEATREMVEELLEDFTIS